MPTAGRTCVSFANLSQIREPRLVVAAGLDTAKVDVVAVRADHVLALAQRLVCDHLDRDPDRTDRAAVGAEGLANLLWFCRPEVLAEGLEELHLVEPVVAAHQGEDDTSVGHDGHRLRSGTGVDPEKLRDVLDRPLPGRLDLLRLR